MIDTARLDQERPIATVWPSIGATKTGRWVGGLCGIRTGFGPVTLGKLYALLTIPVSIVAYFAKILPNSCRRYHLTDRRVVVQRGLSPRDESAVDLDAFDAIAVECLPGQEWLRAGDLVFRREGREVFRLEGVPRPEGFRQICLKAQKALLAVRESAPRHAAADA